MIRNIAISVLLIASLAGNVALIWRRDQPEHIGDNEHKSIARSIEEKNITEEPALPVEVNFETTMNERAAQLRNRGVPEKLIAAALIPSVTRQFTKTILEHDSLKDAAIEADQLRNQWEYLVKSVFGKNFNVRDFQNGRFNSYTKFGLKFQFESDQTNEIHRVIGSIGGVDLSMQQKESLVELFRMFSDDRESLFAELGKLFDEETAEQVILSTDPEYSHAYKRSIAYSSEINKRVRSAKELYEISIERSEELARWDSAEVSDAEKTIGKRAVENRMLRRLNDELGEPAVELIQWNGW